jgi:hypothetical protein
MSGSKAWRIPVALQAVFIIPIIVLVFVVPESPRWLASHGRGNECLEVLARLQGKPTSHQDVMIQHKEIIDAVTLEQSIGSGTWADLLKEDEIKSRRRLLIACSIQFFQQIGGINAIIFYAGTFFSLVTDKAALMAGGLFTWFFVASFIPWMLIDTVGRRKLLLVCIAGMSAAFATESALVWKVQTSSSKAAAGAAVAVLFVYMGLFTVSCVSCYKGRNVWLIIDRVPSYRLGLPFRDPSLETPTKGLVHLYRLQLDHQLHHCPDCPDRSQEHRVEILHRECDLAGEERFHAKTRSLQSSTRPSSLPSTFSTPRQKGFRSRPSTSCSVRTIPPLSKSTKRRSTMQRWSLPRPALGLTTSTRRMFRMLWTSSSEWTRRISSKRYVPACMQLVPGSETDRPRFGYLQRV